MRVYIEPTVFPYCLGESETSEFPKTILEKAKEEKIKLITSALSPLQYVGAIHESFVKRRMDKQSHSDYIFKFRELERDMKNYLTHVYPTQGVRRIAITYVLEHDLYHEDALHIATAKASECDMYVMSDEHRDIDKTQWRKSFDLVSVTNETEVDSASDKINQL